MEEFKKYEEINEPDFRNTIFVAINHDTGEQRPLSLKDIYNDISAINLAESVPEKIRSQFNIVKNLYLYTWYCYSFFQVVEMKCFSVLEYSLAHVANDDGIRGTFMLIMKAIEKEKISQEFIKKDMALENLTKNDHEEFARSFSNFRNDLAHGSTMLHSLSLRIVYRCSLLINHLFEEDKKH